MQQNDTTLLISQNSQGILQKQPLLGVQPRAVVGDGMPFPVLHGHLAVCPPQVHQAQIPAHCQDPPHRRACGPGLSRRVPDVNEHILGQVLGVVGVAVIGQGQAVHRRSGAAI